MDASSSPTLDQQRLTRYGPETSEYSVAVITDEDQATQVHLEDGQVAWRSMLRYDRLHRREDPVTGTVRYSFEEVPPAQGGRQQLIFLPGHPDECIALKSVERDGRTETYVFCFDLDGNLLSDEVFLGKYKCEGVEIL